MSPAARAASWLAGLVGILLVAVGVVYLLVECQALPGILGPTPGDSSPRTTLGVCCAALGAIALCATWLLTRRQRAGGRPR
ncbi:MAG TPA: hypothetical protein VMA83_02895 [Solirubrobacteraceae bacterium]|nr:hypothetical protein [Solirubrobacteraceae bacterium]